MLVFVLFGLILPSRASSVSEGRPAGRGPRLPSTGALWGAYVAIEPNLFRWTSLLAFENMVGRNLVVDRQGYEWDDVFPDSYEYWSRDHGHILSFEWNAEFHGGGVVRWSDIAGGQYDADIDATAARIKAFAAPAFFVFHHEPEDEVGQSGTTQDFINAYRHIHDRFVADGVTNLSYVLQLLAFTFSQGDADLYYPGDSYVDLLGADGYNWNGCPGHGDPWTSFKNVFQGFYDYGLAKRKPLFVTEWGSMEDPAVPGRKAQWITSAAATLKTWPQVKVVTYYHNGPPATKCEWWVDSSPLSLAAYIGMGADPYFDPPVPLPPPTSVASYVSVDDFDFANPVGYPEQGESVRWQFNGPSKHSVTDTSGMGLFDSGTKDAGSTYVLQFRAAAIYTYACTLHPSMTATIRVPLLVAPLSGNTHTAFTVTWAAASPPAGQVYDVKVKRPRSSDWDTWKEGVTSTSGTFVPDAGTGTYSFHSRIRKTADSTYSWWSEDVAISVR